MGLDRHDRFALGVSGYGTKSLTMHDFSNLALKHGFEVAELPFREISGITIRAESGITYIILNSQLDVPEKTVCAWHEAHHALTGHLDGWAMRGAVESEDEWRAEAFGLAAYIPRADAEGLTARQIALAYGVRLKLARLRKLALKTFNL